MSRRFFPLAATDDAFFAEAPARYSDVMDVPLSAEAVWAELTSVTPFSWCRAVSRVTWTSERPFGVGSTRDAVARGGVLVYRERFFRWEAGRRQSFCVTESSLPVVRRHAEDYLIEPLGPDTCRFSWTVAVEPSMLGRPGGPINAFVYRSLFRDARRHFDAS